MLSGLKRHVRDDPQASHICKCNSKSSAIKSRASQKDQNLRVRLESDSTLATPSRTTLLPLCESVGANGAPVSESGPNPFLVINL